MTDLPRGTVTFLFTDIEGSTARWERDRAAMAAAVERHLALLDAAIHNHRGLHGETVRDAVQVTFPAASDAAAATARPRVDWICSTGRPDRACRKGGLRLDGTRGGPREARSSPDQRCPERLPQHCEARLGSVR